VANKSIRQAGRFDFREPHNTEHGRQCAPIRKPPVTRIAVEGPFDQVGYRESRVVENAVFVIRVIVSGVKIVKRSANGSCRTWHASYAKTDQVFTQLYTLPSS